MMLQRSQKPLLISINGLLPALTLEYYAKVRYIILVKMLSSFFIFDVLHFKKFIYLYVYSF